MIAHIALAANMVLATPASTTNYAQPCYIAPSSRNGHDLFLDMKRKDLCAIHAMGYVKGVLDLGDEIWFSIPEDGITWDMIVTIYNVWILENYEKARVYPAYRCVMVAMITAFPKINGDVRKKVVE